MEVTNRGRASVHHSRDTKASSAAHAFCSGRSKVCRSAARSRGSVVHGSGRRAAQAGRAAQAFCFGLSKACGSAARSP